MLVLLLAVAAITRWLPVAATTYTIDKFYSSTDVCSYVPNAVKAVESTDCSSVTCSRDANNDTVTTECQSDFLEAMRLSFGSPQYILQVIYDDSECSTFSYAVGYRVTGSCERGYVATESDYAALFYFTATLPDDGTAVLDFFATSDCSTTFESSNSSEIGDVHAPENILQAATCIAVDYSSYMYLNTGYCQWYSSNTYDDGGLSTAAVIGVVCGCVVVALIIAAAVFYARRRSKSKREGHWTVTLPSGDLTTLETAMHGQAGLWNDDVITTKRVSRDKYDVKADIFSFGVVLSELDMHTLPGTPYSVSAYEADTDCVEEACSDFQEDSSSVSADMVTFSCTSDYLSALRQVFGDSPYIIQAQYADEGCKTFSFAYGYPAWGNYEGSYYKNESNYVIGKLSTTDGSASLQIFNETQCLSSSLYEAYSASKDTL
ncbi:hypothetical protein PF011_g8713 [Phytophthora fragariae]|uniref:Protein kinase domain-containing protein n=1 Tax=Phytophthora fragariae TaxID=53985 RepID=A0A6A3L4E5_9STRA|nr:hypothetical protein PF011_g8713 [Phytophthora fragariae]